MRLRLLAAALVLAEAGSSSAAPGPPASVSELGWLAGGWTGEGLGGVLHESYSAPAGGQIAAHFYALKDGTIAFYEFELFAEVGGSIEYRVRHFDPDMTAWEDKAQFVRFPLVRVETDKWHFDGYTIERTGPDTARHVLRIKDRNGRDKEVVLQFRRLSTGGPRNACSERVDEPSAEPAAEREDEGAREAEHNCRGR